MIIDTDMIDVPVSHDPEIYSRRVKVTVWIWGWPISFVLPLRLAYLLGL